ncbi:hypothetical protein [Microtetraspora glauca]|uniref:Uncharacterized protein n=1 Tax=Microtetraspora glauca TaxID=1996 RepID=A0ABV3GNS3_MICGL
MTELVEVVNRHSTLVMRPTKEGMTEPAEVTIKHSTLVMRPTKEVS